MLCVLSLNIIFASAVPRCPTYQTNLIVNVVDSTPHTAPVGTVVVTTVHIIYPDGTPVVLSPQTISFVWSGFSGQKVVENAAVIPTGDPGFYRYTETVTEYYPTGTVTIAVLYCSCSDALANRDPTDYVSSDTTITSDDDSKVNIGPVTSIPPTVVQPPGIGQLIATYAVPIVIAVLLIIALLLLLFRARRGQT